MSTSQPTLDEPLTPDTWHSHRSGPPESFALSWRSMWIIVLYGASMLLLNLGSTRVLTYHEVLFAQPAKEMIASGEWMLPRFNGLPSTHKPPGAHWSIALMMLLTGTDSEGYMRIPSVLAAIATSVILGFMAARWFGNKVGLVTGLMQFSLYYVLQLGRLAECDMLLIAAMCGTMYFFMIANVESPRGRETARWLPWAFYGCLGLSYLFKGLVGPVFLLPACTLYALVQRDSSIFRFLLSPIGIGIFAFCSVGWFVAAYFVDPVILHDQISHHLGRFQGEMGGQKTWYYYLYQFSLITLPWLPFMAIGAWRGLRSGMFRDPLWRLAACWIVPGMCVLLASAFKSKHYAAPLMPPLTMLAAVAMLDNIRRRQQYPAWMHAGSAAIILIGCGVAGWIVWDKQPLGYQAIVPLVGVLGVGLAVICWFEYRRMLQAQLVTLFAMIWILVVGVLGYVMPYHDSYRDQRQLAAQINEHLPDQAELYIVELPENQIAYYIDHPMLRTDAKDKFYDDLTESEAQERYILAPEFVADELNSLGTVERLDACASVGRTMEEKERLTLVRFVPVAKMVERYRQNATGGRTQ